MQELRASLEKQCAQSNQLCVALKHEQTAKDNLRKELQIEASRCEALLAQERGRLSELQRSLEAEQGRSRELSEALQHERLLTERLSRRPQDKQAQPALLQKLRGCEARVLELEVALETARQRALEAEAHVHRQDVEREQEVSAAPRPPVETPPRAWGSLEQPGRQDGSAAEAEPSGHGEVEQVADRQGDVGEPATAGGPVLAPGCPLVWSVRRLEVGKRASSDLVLSQGGFGSSGPLAVPCASEDRLFRFCVKALGILVGITLSL